MRERSGIVIAALGAAFLVLACVAAAAAAKGAGQPIADLSGQWRLDAGRSDQPRMPESVRPRHRGDAWGGWGGRGGGSSMPGADGMPTAGPGGTAGGPEGGPDEGEGRPAGGEAGGQGSFGHRRSAEDSSLVFGPRPVRLPELLRIEQAGKLVTFADSTGTIVQEIGIDVIPADTSAHDAVQAMGEWKKSRLVVERSGIGGAKVTESYELKDEGRSLEVRTRIESDGPTPTIQFKRVYLRADARADGAH